MLDDLTIQMIVRLCLAALLGGIVGVERGSGDRPAGLRTHILVCAGSALIMLVSLYGNDGLQGSRDSSRIAAQVVSGIGFLGAGTILHEGLTVRGLTTAASLWMVSAIGLAVGSGMLVVSVFATVIMMITLITFHDLEKRFTPVGKTERRYIRVIVKRNMDGTSKVLDYLAKNHAKTRTLSIKDNDTNNTIAIELYIKMPKTDDVDKLIMGINSLQEVISVQEVV